MKIVNDFLLNNEIEWLVNNEIQKKTASCGSLFLYS